jgi:hypothetical protein
VLWQNDAMPTTFAALSVAVLAILPGALYSWSLERLTGRWGIGLADRTLRFIGISAIFHAVSAPVTYWLWANWWPMAQAGASLPLWLWLIVVAFIGLPLLAGYLSGEGVRRQRRWARLLLGPDPAPRAWDAVFRPGSSGWIRLRLKSGRWLGGAFAQNGDRRSYAAGYGDVQDLFLSLTVAVDPNTGEFCLDSQGSVVVHQGGILIRWDEVEYLSFTDA